VDEEGRNLVPKGLERIKIIILTGIARSEMLNPSAPLASERPCVDALEQDLLATGEVGQAASESEADVLY
jgi:hypothetical protein